MKNNAFTVVHLVDQIGLVIPSRESYDELSFPAYE